MNTFLFFFFIWFTFKSIGFPTNLDSGRRVAKVRCNGQTHIITD